MVADETELCDVSYKANFKSLGRKCGPKMKAVAAAIAAMGKDGGSGAPEPWPKVIEGVEVALDDVLITRSPKAGLVVASEDEIVVGLETALTPELVAEGNAREFVSRVQAMRKEADFEVTQRIKVSVSADAEFRAALESHVEYVKGETLALELSLSDGSGDVELNGHRVSIEVKAV